MWPLMLRTRGSEGGKGVECKGRISGKGHKKGDFKGNEKYFHSQKLMNIKKKGYENGDGGCREF